MKVGPISDRVPIKFPHKASPVKGNSQTGQQGHVYPTGTNARRAPATGPFRHRGLIENQHTPGRSGKGSQRTGQQPEAKPKHTQRTTQKRPVPRQQTHQKERKGRAMTRQAFARDKPNSGQARLLKRADLSTNIASEIRSHCWLIRGRSLEQHTSALKEDPEASRPTGAIAQPPPGRGQTSNPGADARIRPGWSWAA